MFFTLKPFGKNLVFVLTLTLIFSITEHARAQVPQVYNFASVSDFTANQMTLSAGDIVRLQEGGVWTDNRSRYYIIEQDASVDVNEEDNVYVIRVNANLVARFRNDPGFQCGEDDIYNITCPKYEALRDGTDYHAAIQQALDDASLNGGGTVILPGNQTYLITKNLNIHSNTTLKASHGFAKLSVEKNYSGGSYILRAVQVDNVVIEGLEFDGDSITGGVLCDGNGSSTFNSNIQIRNCRFSKHARNNTTIQGTAIFIRKGKNVEVSNCLFSTSDLGVYILGRNSEIFINENEFEPTLTNNPIRVQSSGHERSNNIWIEKNEIDVGRGISIIDSLSLSRTDSTGHVNISGITSNPIYQHWRTHDFAPSAINITTGENGFHEDIFILDNVVNGPDYGFFDGGSADLYALKDILRLRCSNNSSRNSGDLGFAIERCVGAIISSNHAERNNSGGIGLSFSRNCVVTGNQCNNNGLMRNLIYNNIYGGIMIVGGSYGNIIEGNHLFSNSFINVSFPDTNPYTVRRLPSQHYGIVIRAAKDVGAGDTNLIVPLRNKIGVNNYNNNRWGTIYTESEHTEVAEVFSEKEFPTSVSEKDYPMGTWIRNRELDGSVLGWGVKDRVETRLSSDSYQGQTTITVEDPVGIAPQQIIGIELNSVNGVEVGLGYIHWTTVLSVSGNTITIEDPIVDPDPTDGVTDAALQFGQVVSLMWQVVDY